MALLDIVQNAASQVGLRQPDFVVGSTDITAQILYRCANAGGKELARYHDWQDLIVEVSATATATIVQTGMLPAEDYDRMIYNAEIWNTTTSTRYTGPTPQRAWRQMQALGLGGASGFWRIMRGELCLYPAPAANDIIVFEYISKRWAQTNAGVAQSAMMADTDVSLISEDLITLETVWRFQQSRGFAQYAESMATCEIEKEKAASRDRGTGRIRPSRDASNSELIASTFQGVINN